MPLRLRSAIFVLLIALNAFAEASDTVVARAATRKVSANALPPFTAIQAKGFIESTEYGFRFPDGSVQASAATVTGGVPSVNGIATAVSIAGNGSTSVATNGSTITVTTPILYKRTVIVGPVLNNETASGAAVRNALDGITGATATNRYLLKIEPGVYDLGTNYLQMKPFVDIEGSGKGATMLMMVRSGLSGAPTSAGVIAAGSSELRDLSIFNRGNAGANAAAVVAEEVSNFRTSNVFLRTTCPGASWGLYVTDSEVEAFRVSFSTGEGSGNRAVGVQVMGESNVSLSNCDATVTGAGTSDTAAGLFVNGVLAVVTVDSSRIYVGGTTDFIHGINNVTGSVVVSNSVVEIEGAPSLTALATGTSIFSRLSVHHSRILVGSGDSSPLTALRGSNSLLRIYSSLATNASQGSPTCIFSYESSGPLTSTCASAP
jgi:hypothetical protein